MTCPRHRAVALSIEYGWPLCLACFEEAFEHARMEALERPAMSSWMRAHAVTPDQFARLHSASALMDRLRWDRPSR